MFCFDSRLGVDSSKEGMEVRLVWRHVSLIEVRLWSRMVSFKVSVVVVKSCVSVFFIMASPPDH